MNRTNTLDLDREYCKALSIVNDLRVEKDKLRAELEAVKAQLELTRVALENAQNTESHIHTSGGSYPDLQSTLERAKDASISCRKQAEIYKANYDIAKAELEQATTALHDIFEESSRQKSHRDCATLDGLINTAKAAVRVIRKVCDDKKAELAQAQAQAAEMRSEIEHAASAPGCEWLSMQLRLAKLLEKTDCGKGWLSPDKAMVVREGFMFLFECGTIYQRIAWRQVPRVAAALAALEDKR